MLFIRGAETGEEQTERLIKVMLWMRPTGVACALRRNYFNVLINSPVHFTGFMGIKDIFSAANICTGVLCQQCEALDFNKLADASWDM